MEEYLTEHKAHFGSHLFTEYEYSKLNENLQVILYSLISFLVPFTLAHPQFLVGTIVNMMLILGAQNLKGYKLFAMIFMPSIGVFSAGIIFSTLTKYLLYFMPMIWVSNIILVYGYKYFRYHFKLNEIKSVSISIVFKVILLSVNAFLLVGFLGVPDMFLKVMSIFQLVTAIVGAVGAIIVTKFVLSRFSN